jgi:hypothetical protein
MTKRVEYVGEIQINWLLLNNINVIRLLRVVSQKYYVEPKYSYAERTKFDTLNDNINFNIGVINIQGFPSLMRHNTIKKC